MKTIASVFDKVKFVVDGGKNFHVIYFFLSVEYLPPFKSQSDFNNGRSTVPVLPDTGVVLAISTGAVLVPVLDDNALPVLAFQHWLHTVCRTRYQITCTGVVLSPSTDALLSCQYWCSTK